MLTFQERLTIDIDNRAAFIDGCAMKLSSREAKLICHLALHADMTVDSEEIINEVWNAKCGGEKVAAAISSLRWKIENNPKFPVFIKTVYGKGYMLCSSDK